MISPRRFIVLSLAAWCALAPATAGAQGDPAADVQLIEARRLLLDELALAPTWIADVVLPRANEERLTGWMRAHLRLTWCACADLRERLPEVVEALGPGLDPEHEPARSALARFVAAAGDRGDRVVAAPFRRP